MSATPLPVPEACRRAYDRYLADLNRSALAAGTRARRARYVRRFLRWLATDGGDAATVLAHHEAWDQAVARFVSDLAASAGMTTIDGYREALADCARRLGLAKPPTSPRFGWVRDGYATALARGPHPAAAIRSNLTTVRAFLRWFGETGYAGDLRRDWDTAVERYLQHLAANGRAASSVRRYRQVLNHCAGRLKLPTALVAVANPGGDGSTAPAARRRLAQFARTQNYWLGGKDNGAVDREVGKHVAELLPSIRAQARAARLFSNRAVRHLAEAHHIRQFIDIGIAFPSGDSTHEVAQRVAPDCKIVYVDHDPVLLAHARALLTSHPGGACGYVDAGPAEPGKILHAAAETLDLAAPVALLLAGVLHHLPGDDQAAGVVARLADALAPGSFVAISHVTGVVHGAASEKAWQYWNEHGTPRVVLRSPDHITRLFGGLELLEPGVVPCSRWQQEVLPWGLPGPVDEFCGLARKPGGS